MKDLQSLDKLNKEAILHSYQRATHEHNDWLQSALRVAHPDLEPEFDNLDKLGPQEKPNDIDSPLYPRD